MFSNCPWLCSLVFSDMSNVFVFLLYLLACGCSRLWDLFSVVSRCSWLIYDMFGELFQLVFSCFNFLNVVSGCSKCLMLAIAMVCSKLFYVVFSVIKGSSRWRSVVFSLT